MNKKRGGSNVKDMTNERKGVLTVLKRNGSKRKLAVWQCQCDCGNIVDCLGSDLRNGKTRSCGCRLGSTSKTNWQGYKDLSKTYWRTIGQNAKQRNIEIDITIEYAYELYIQQNKKCSLSGADISLDLDHHTASLDRIDNNKGYIKGNVQWLHKDINKLKNTFSEEKLLSLVKDIYEYRFK